MCFNSLSAQKKPTAQQPQTLQKPDIRKAFYSPLWSRCGHHAALPDTKTLSDVTKHNLEHDFYCLKQSQNPCRAPGGPPCTGPYLLLWPCFCHCPLAQSVCFSHMPYSVLLLNIPIHFPLTGKFSLQVLWPIPHFIQVTSNVVSSETSWIPLLKTAALFIFDSLLYFSSQPFIRHFIHPQMRAHTHTCSLSPH